MFSVCFFTFHALCVFFFLFFFLSSFHPLVGDSDKGESSDVSLTNPFFAVRRLWFTCFSPCRIHPHNDEPAVNIHILAFLFADY